MEADDPLWRREQPKGEELVILSFISLFWGGEYGEF